MDVKLPRLGEGSESGIVANIFVKEGDTVQKDQAIIELESDKAVASIPSTISGVVTKIYVSKGAEVRVGQSLIALEEGKAAAQPAAKSAPAAAQPASAQKPAETVQPSAEQSAPASNAFAGNAAPSVPGIPPAASPTVRKIAKDLGIDLSKVRGSERGGRIIIEDLKAYIEQLQAMAFQARPAGTASEAPRAEKPAPKVIDFSKWGPVQKKPMTQIRKTISDRMMENWSTIPHVTQFDEADVTQLLELRKKYVQAYEKKGVKLTVTSFVLKAVANALKKHKIVNSSVDDVNKEIIFKDYVHLGVAVDTEQGLLVPVIRDADKKNLFDLSVSLFELAEKTRQKKISIEEMQGGTFTISNLGIIGGGHFTPIINKPEVAILGIGKGLIKPVYQGTKLQPRNMMPLALSYDHRVVDGADGGRFMQELIQQLQNFKDEDVKLSESKKGKK
jgi:pyruvate dehydrogenase E2 component (dihydrolipoamide acetyltransferase)